MPTFVFAGLFFLFFLLVAGSALAQHWRYRRDNAQPIHKNRAKLLGKQMLPGIRHHFSGARPYTVSLRRYRATFSLETGENAVFDLTHPQYQALDSQQEGILVWRGTTFLDFLESP